MLTTSLGLRTGSFGTSTYFDDLSSDELGLDLGFSIFEQHGDDFTQIRVQLIERLGLRVCSRKTRDESDEKAGFRRALDDGGEGLHDEKRNTPDRLSILILVNPTALAFNRAAGS